MPEKKYYMVGAISSKHSVNLTLGGIASVLPLDLRWADGMCGVMPVFTNKKKANKYANKQYRIIEFVAKNTITKMDKSE